MASEPDALQPELFDFATRSVAEAVMNALEYTGPGFGFVAMADDRDKRRAMMKMRADTDFMCTRSFIRWIAEDFGGADPLQVWRRLTHATQPLPQE